MAQVDFSEALPFQISWPQLQAPSCAAGSPTLHPSSTHLLPPLSGLQCNTRTRPHGPLGFILQYQAVAGGGLVLTQLLEDILVAHGHGLGGREDDHGNKGAIS